MILSVIPKLPFIQKQSTLDFYIAKLRFELLSDYGDYFLLKKDQAEFHFFEFPSLEPTKSDFMVYLRIDKGIEDLYKEIQKKGVSIHPNGPLQIKPWKQQEFSIIDPNGTLLTFGQAII